MWIWAVRFLLMFLSVILVHVLWRMPLASSWGWAGYSRVGLAGMLGVVLWFLFDRIRREWSS